LDVNGLVQKAAKQKIDILLQPIKTQGPMGLTHSTWNQLTAVDNGYTLIRCASGGRSGAFDQYHRSHAQKITLPQDDSLVMAVPLFGHSTTGYSLWGNLLGWVSAVLVVCWVVLLVLLRLKSWSRFSYQFRAFLESLDAHFGNRSAISGA
jgi:hypothetical protein